jgi:signal transduction histidine kinase
VRVDTDVWDRTGRVWRAAFALCWAGSVALVVVDGPAGTRPAALAVLAAFALAHLALGRRAQRDLAGLAWVLTSAALAVAATALAPTASILLLLVVFPMAWLLLPMWRAVAAVGAVLAGVLAVQVAAMGAWDPVTAAVFAAMFGMSVLLGLWITRIVAQSRRRADLLTELERTRAELADVSRERGALAERQRIAREVHDTLAQGFTSILMLVRSMPPGDPRLALVEQAAADNLAEARALVAATPPRLTGVALPDALGTLVARFGAELGIAAGLRVHGTSRPLPAGHDVALLRITQEALANVRKHAGAHRVDVELAFADAGSPVTLRVGDDGRGFDPVAPCTGSGLGGIRERVDELGGALALTSAPGAGTRVEVRLP